jgi:hypothetical protein
MVGVTTIVLTGLLHKPGVGIFKLFKEVRNRFKGIDSPDYKALTGIYKQTMGSRNRVGIGLS